MVKKWIVILFCLFIFFVSWDVLQAKDLLICRRVDETGPGESGKSSSNKAAAENWKMSQTFWKQGDYKKAVEFAREVVKADPKNALAYTFIAWIYIKGNPSFPPNPHEALPYARKGAELDPYSLPSRFWLAIAYLESGKYKEAMSSLEICDKLNFKTKEQYFQPRILYARSRILAVEKNEAKALEYLKSAIKRDTGFAYLAASQKDFDSLRGNQEFIKLSNYRKYDLNMRKKIENAITKAKYDNKRIFVHFSGNWGKNDNMFGKALKQPEIAEILKKKYYYIRVDVGRFTRNMSLFREYADLSPYTEVIPYIVILNGNGEILTRNNGVPLKEKIQEDYSLVKIKEFLESFAQ